jgi:hypothetical protein
MKSQGLAKAVAIGLAIGAAMLLSTGGAFASEALKLNFVTHAAFFSQETKQPQAIDPQVFVHDPAAAEAVGPQGIKHVAGLRPARIDQDPKTTPVFTALDKPLGFDLGAWLGASGSVVVADDGGKVTLTANFAGLRPNGEYSLFENHFDQKPVGFTPMDGTGQTNSFVAGPDGSAKVAMTLAHVPTHANAVLLVFHSDGQTHGAERGQIGVEAHHQLIARPE